MQSSNNPVLKSWVALPIIAAIAIAASATFTGVRAQVQDDEARPEATLTDYAEFQYATLTGTTNTINATMVPIVTGTTTAYKNITFAVTVAANGTVTIVPGSPTVVASPSVNAAGFKAGPYLGPSNLFEGNGLITVNGPGVTAGGATEWSISTAAGANNCTYPSSASWYVGSPTAANNPLAGRLKKALITSTAYSYGILGNSAGCGDGYWDAGALLGFSQVGNSITVTSFSYQGSTDYNTPKEQVTFTWK